MTSFRRWLIESRREDARKQIQTLEDLEAYRGKEEDLSYWSKILHDDNEAMETAALFRSGEVYEDDERFGSFVFSPHDPQWVRADDRHEELVSIEEVQNHTKYGIEFFATGVTDEDTVWGVAVCSVDTRIEPWFYGTDLDTVVTAAWRHHVG